MDYPGGPLYLTISTIDRRLRRHLKLTVQVSDGATSARAEAMLDSGASSVFVNEGFATRHGLKLRPLERPIHLRNADNSPNAIGCIRHDVLLTVDIDGHVEQLAAAVANIGDDDLIIGIDWLRHHNPEIDWTHDKVRLSRCPTNCDNEVRKAARRAARKPVKATPKVRVESTAPRVAIAELDDEVELADEVEVETVAEEMSPREGISRAEWDKVPPGYRYSDTYWDTYHDAQEFFVTDSDYFAYKCHAVA